MPEPNVLVNLAKECVTYLIHPFGVGALSTEGVQYGTSGVSTSTDVWKVVETKTIRPFAEGGYFSDTVEIVEIECQLAANAIWSSTDGTGGVVTYAWQMKSNATTNTSDWRWMTPTSSGLSTAIGSSAGDTSVLSGRFTITAGKNDTLPAQVRLLVVGGGKGSDTSGSSSTGAYVRAKGSTEFKILYRIS